jgi:hypothetical protein
MFLWNDKWYDNNHEITDHMISSQRGNQKAYIKDGHAMQWPKDTKGVIRSRISKTDMQYNDQKIPKG